MRKKVVLLMIVAVALMALPALAQNYGNPYKPATQNGMQQVGTTVPSASFQSTSAMTSSGSTYSANPTLNSDGTASYGAFKGGPLRAKMEGDDDEEEGGGMVIDTPPGGGDDKIPSPLGDAVLPLLLMAFAFCGYLYLRRRREVKG